MPFTKNTKKIKHQKGPKSMVHFRAVWVRYHCLFLGWATELREKASIAHQWDVDLQSVTWGRDLKDDLIEWIRGCQHLLESIGLYSKTSQRMWTVREHAGFYEMMKARRRELEVRFNSMKPWCEAVLTLPWMVGSDDEEDK